MSAMSDSPARKHGRTSSGERYVTDEKGNRIAVVVPIEEYERMLEDLEELDDIRAYDEAKSSAEKPVPWAEAKKRLGLSGE